MNVTKSDLESFIESIKEFRIDWTNEHAQIAKRLDIMNKRLMNIEMMLRDRG